MKIRLKYLLPVAILLIFTSLLLIWNASLFLSASDVSRLVGESVEASFSGGEAIVVIASASPLVEKLRSGPETLEIGGYDFRRTSEHPASDEESEIWHYSSSGWVHRMSLSIDRSYGIDGMEEPGIAITLQQVAGFGKLIPGN